MSSFFRRIFSARSDPGIRLVVFDFDGTLADTHELLMRIVSKHLGKFNISLTKQLILQFGNAPLHDYISIVGLRKDFIRSVSSSIIEDFMAEYHRIKPCKALATVKSISVKKIIVSNNVTPFIEKTLHFLHANFFDEVYGSDRFTNKFHAIKKLCQKYHVSSEEVVYVGDKSIDVAIARRVGCYSIIVAGPSAWSPRSAILAMRPDYVVRDLSKIPAIIKSINTAQFSSV